MNLQFTGECVELPRSMNGEMTRMQHPNFKKREQIDLALRRAGGNVSKAARMLGMHRRTLQRIRDKRVCEFYEIGE